MKNNFNSSHPDAENVAMLDEHRTPKQPWQTLHHGEVTPLMFEAVILDGCRRSFAYSDLRDCTLFNPGKLVIGLWGRKETIITVQGKNLDDLYAHLLVGKIRWIAESDRRAPEAAEDKGRIDSITIQEVTEENGK